MRLIKLILVTFVLPFSLFILGSWFYAGSVVAYYKPNIEKVLSDKTGYTITFDSASVKFYPYIGIKLTGLSADSSAGCAPWQVEQTSIKIALRPLLNRRIDILRIDFSGIEGALRLTGEGVVTTNREGKICGLNAVANQSKNADSMPSRAPVENTTQSVHEDFPINLSLDKVTIEQVKLNIFREKQKYLFLIDQAQAAVQLNDQGVFLPQLFINGALDADKIALEVKDLQSNAENSAFKLAAARVQVDQQKLMFSGEYDRRTANGNFSLDLSAISLQQLSKIAADSIPKSQGVVNGQF